METHLWDENVVIPLIILILYNSSTSLSTLNDQIPIFYENSRVDNSRVRHKNVSSGKKNVVSTKSLSTLDDQIHNFWDPQLSS